MQPELPRMYDELASWFHLLSPPADYAGEAEFYERTLRAAARRPLQTVLELGSGGGCMASHMKKQFTLTLTDVSPKMLALSRTINTECEHINGDMRTLRLGRTFDAVFVHDAVCYMTTETDLQQAIETAFVHCRPGGAAIFVPDYIRDNFFARANHGGEDGDRRALRYLEWTTDPDPTDSTYLVDYVYVLHEDGKPSRAAHDQHVEGLFSRDEWLRLLTEAGFDAHDVPADVPDAPEGYTMFVAVRD